MSGVTAEPDRAGRPRRCGRHGCDRGELPGRFEVLGGRHAQLDDGYDRRTVSGTVSDNGSGWRTGLDELARTEGAMGG
jgi:hypothetical protein